MRGIDELVRQVSGRSYAVLNGRLLLDGGDLDLLIALAEEAVAARGLLSDSGLHRWGSFTPDDCDAMDDAAHAYVNARPATDAALKRLGGGT